MIHVNIKITILVFVKTSKLEKDLQWKIFKTYLDILRMEDNDFPEIKQLKFGFLPGSVTTPHCDFLKYLRNKPELVYNILSIDIKSINQEIEPIINKIKAHEEKKRKIKEEKIKKKYNDKIQKIANETKDEQLIKKKKRKIKKWTKKRNRKVNTWDWRNIKYFFFIWLYI